MVFKTIKHDICKLLERHSFLSSRRIYLALESQYTKASIRNVLSEMRHSLKLIYVADWETQGALRGQVSPIYGLIVEGDETCVDVPRPEGLWRSKNAKMHRVHLYRQRQKEKMIRLQVAEARVKELEAIIEDQHAELSRLRRNRASNPVFEGLTQAQAGY